MSDAGDPLRAVAPQTVRQVLDIRNRRGLHARASAKFVQTAMEFDSAITVERDGASVDGKSILDLMMLAAADGTHINVEASGVDAQEAIAALAALVDDRFGEGE